MADDSRASASSEHSLQDYFVRVAVPGRPPVILFEVTVACVDGPQDACTVATTKWAKVGGDTAVADNAWVEVFEVSGDIIVLRVPARLAAPHRC